MALYKYTQASLFTTGLNQDVDDKILQVELQEADNLVMSKIGRLECRKGFQSLPNTVHNSEDVIKNGEILQSYNNELLLLSRNSLYSYSNTAESWVKRADKLTVVNNTRSFSRSPEGQESPVYVRDNVGGGVVGYKEGDFHYYDSFERDSGLKLAKKKRIEPDFEIQSLQIIYDNNYFCFIYSDNANNIYFRRCANTTPENLEERQVLQTDVNIADPLLRVFRYNGSWLGLAYKNDNEKLTIFYFNNAGTLATEDDGLVEKTEFNDIDLTWNLEVAVKEGTIPVIYINNFIAGDLFLHVISNELNVIYSEVIRDGITLHNVTNIVVGNFLHIFHTEMGAQRRVERTTINTTQLTEPPQVNLVTRSVSLISEAFEFDDNVFILTSYNSIFQGCYFIINGLTGEPEGRIDYLTGSNEDDELLKVVVEGDREFSVVARTKTRVVKDGEAYDITTGLDIHNFIFESPREYQAIPFSDNLIISGSIPHIYDSNSYSELGFLLYPEGLEAIPDFHASGEMKNDTTEGVITLYFYTVVYSWVDGKGNIHRSAPHPILTVEMGETNNSVNLIIPTLRVTKKEDVQIEIYRSEVNGAVNHKIAVLPNDKTVDFLTYEDLRNDEGLIQLEPLYTTGGVLENAPPRSCKYMTVFQNRLFLAGLRDTKSIQYSHEVAEGFPAEFSDFSLTTTPIEEPITAIYGLGNFLVVFTENSVGIIVGEGADVTGVGASYRFEYLTKEMGCISVHSLLETKNGLYFQSKRGIHLLSRSGEIVFIGSFVKDYKDIITSTQNIQDRQELRFNTASYTLVYNEHFNVWTTFSNVGGISTTSHRGELYRLNTTGDEVYKESEDYSDNGSAISTKLKTSWIKASHLHSFQRLYKAAFVGIRRDAHQGQINVYYNHDQNVAETFNYESEKLNTWGTVSWGEMDFDMKGDGDLYFEVRPRKQKCSSIAFELVTVHPNNQPTPGISLTGLAFTIGLKRPLRKGGMGNRAKPSS